MPVAKSLRTNLSLAPPVESPSTVPKFVQLKEPKCQATKIAQIRSRRIRFAEYDDVLEIPHIIDLSDEEVEDVWMTPYEMREVRRQAKRAVALMEDPDIDEQAQGLCTRGLDQHTAFYCDRRDAIRELIYEAVFTIQSYKTIKEVDSQNLMAELCQKYSAASVAAALLLAKLDAEAVAEPQR